MVDRRQGSTRSASDRKKRKKRQRRRRAAILLLELIVLLVVLAGFYLISKWDKIQHVNLNPDDVVINTDINESYVEEMVRGYTNLAFFCVDSFHNTDVIMLCSINEDTGEIRVSSVYRDMVALLEDGTYDKINQGMNHGEYEGTSEMNALNMNLDLSLEEYVMVDWVAVATLINWMGGVDVYVTEAMMQEINSYITDTVENLDGVIGSHHLIQAGMQHLDGPQAIAYCRLRHQDSDLGRTQRQREVLAQLFAKAKQMDMGRLMQMVDGIFPYITTTMNLTDVFAMVGNIGKYYLGEMRGFPYYQQSVENWPSDPDWWPMFATNLENNVTQLHEFLYGTKDYAPSATVRRISRELDEMSGFPAAQTTAFPEE